MAFYNQEMAGNKSLRKAWRAAHFNKFDADEETCLPEICDEIGRWMRRGRHPRSRLSLRSFSVLLSGATRIYKQQLNNLLNDCSEEERRQQLQLMPVIEITDCSEEETRQPLQLMPVIEITDSSEEETLQPLQLMPVIEITDSSEEETLQPLQLMPVIEITDTTTPSNGSQPEPTECSPDSTESSSTDEFDEIMSDESTVFTVTPNTNHKLSTGAQEKRKTTNDQQIQTCPFETRDQQIQTCPLPVMGDIGRFDQNLPFGYVIVHDNYHSRIPSKILFTSMSENATSSRFPSQ